MTPKARWSILLAVLATSAGLVLFDHPEASSNTAIVEPVPARGPRPLSTTDEFAAQESLPASPGQQASLLELLPRAPSNDPGEAFSIRSWTPPPPPPPPPADPSAPPLPFTFLGKQLEDGVWQVFLSRGDLTYIAKEKGVIDALYRVEAIAPPTLTFTYLPLQQQQSLSIGDP